jgi:hypothetical protein
MPVEHKPRCEWCGVDMSTPMHPKMQGYHGHCLIAKLESTAKTTTGLQSEVAAQMAKQLREQGYDKKA